MKLVYDGRHDSILRQFKIVVVAIGNSARGMCRTGSNEVAACNSYHFRHVYCRHLTLPCVVDSSSLRTTGLNGAFHTPSFNQCLVVAGAESDRGLLMVWLYTEEFWLEYWWWEGAEREEEGREEGTWVVGSSGISFLSSGVSTSGPKENTESLFPLFHTNPSIQVVTLWLLCGYSHN